MPQFQNREPIVTRICDFSGEHHGQITVITGEAGIGKSAVLDASAGKIDARDSGALILRTDFEQIAESEQDFKSAFLQALTVQIGAALSPFVIQPDMAGMQLAAALNLLPADRRVYLFCDTTEVVQDQRGLWKWLEESFLQPLLTVDRLRIVFAGRIAPPFQVYEVRRALYKETLQPLDLHPGEALIREVLHEEAPEMPAHKVEQAIKLVQGIAFGHAALSETLARYVAGREAQLGSAGFEAELCEIVVDPFVRREMMPGLEGPWAAVIPWITILNSFDATILTAFLKRQAPDTMEEQSDHFFIQGISQLRQRNQVVWKENVGYQVEGVLGQILRRCLTTRYPEAYRKACEVAADTFEGIAYTFRDDPVQASYYNTEAEFYRHRADQLSVQMIGGPT